MKNNLPALCLLAAVLPAQAVLAPLTLDVPAGGQADVRISSTNPNYFEVPGDRITGVTSAPGTLTETRNTPAGGAFLSTVQDKPFTLFLTTEGGQTFSLSAHPSAVAGRSYRLAPQKPLPRPAARAWERAQPYEALLAEVNRTLLQGALPPGWAAVAVAVSPDKAPPRLPAALRAAPDAAWEGGHLRVTRWRLTNPGRAAVPLREPQFSGPDVRAVMFATPGRALAGGGSTDVYVTQSREDADGER
jgi:conjugal transfer pilus assembly protein TraK